MQPKNNYAHSMAKGLFDQPQLNQLEDTLELYLVKKAPALPTNAKEIIVKFGPWITLILFVLSLPLVLALFGLGAFLAPFSFMGGLSAGFNYTLAMVVLAVTLVLEGLAIPGLFKQQKRAWYLMYYAVLLGALSNLLQINIFSFIIGTLISLYILFQIKSYYTN